MKEGARERVSEGKSEWENERGSKNDTDGRKEECITTRGEVKASVRERGCGDTETRDRARESVTETQTEYASPS